MDMAGVKLEFLQLTSPRPPATKYFPETAICLLVHISPCNLTQPMTSRRDIWPRGKCRNFLAKMPKFVFRKNSLRTSVVRF